MTRRESAGAVMCAAALPQTTNAARQAMTAAPQAAATRTSGDALAALTLSEASARLRSGAVTSVDLVQACLARIEIYNPKINAFITVMRDAALAQAKALDAEQKAGKVRGPLHGVPIALKDNIDTA